ncbi:MAG: PaaR repeat-containing protein [Chloroflexi bacterium]|nr:MAG: PaaR repeat-containing protein [Chloroflexota bacterium]
MPQPAARVGDLTTHGGVILPPGNPTVLIGGMPAACVGDMQTCPLSDGPKPHVGGPITGPGSPTVLIGGRPAARVNDLTQCAGPPGTVAPPGCLTVLIGP